MPATPATPATPPASAVSGSARHGVAGPALRQIGDLPGPRPWPLVGNVPQMDQASIHPTVERWSRLHGPFFRVRFGATPMLAVADHEAVAAILRDRPDALSDALTLTLRNSAFPCRPACYAHTSTFAQCRKS